MTRRTQPPFLLEVKNQISQHNLCTSGQRIVVAHSGGADSTALLHVLFRLAPELKIQLAVAHVNHGIRGKTAQRDQFASQKNAQDLGLPFFTTKVDALGHAKKNKVGVEEAARLLRHAFFKKTMKEWGADRLATGHHMDDAAEQLLFNLLRGSGLTGLSAMAPATKNGIIRPLLTVSRQQIHQWLKEEMLTFVTDETNSDTTYTRNRIRHQLLPLLQNEFNPSAAQTLARTATLLRDEEAWLEEMAQTAFQTCLLDNSATRVILDAQSLTRQPSAAQRRILRLAAHALLGSTQALTHRHIQSSIDLLDPPQKRRSVDLCRGLRATCEAKTLTLEMHKGSLRHIPPQKKAPDFFCTIEYFSSDKKKEVTLPETGHRFLFAWKRVPNDFVPRPGSNEIYLDAKAISWPLTLRNMRPGDRFSPEGGAGSRKIKRFFTDCGLKGTQRSMQPLLLSATQIIWVAGLRKDQAWSEPATGTMALRVTFQEPN